MASKGILQSIYDEPDEDIYGLGISLFKPSRKRDKETMRREGHKRNVAARKASVLERKRKREESIARSRSRRRSRRKASWLERLFGRRMARSRAGRAKTSAEAMSLRREEAVAVKAAHARPRKVSVAPVRPRPTSLARVRGRIQSVIHCGTSLRETAVIARNLKNQYPGRVFKASGLRRKK